MADADDIPFLLTFRKPETQTWGEGGSVIWEEESVSVQSK